ncbi:putative DsbA family dithiol-disulfide isomerase [Chitinophaga skermanii]|uniref:Putative DsbA family dithiol-disulfide isomerase n=1 Tax=Chitinophaga skermanii TaxID=331697 RepID=A0A327PZQ4_9BACT|nr:ClpXP adapter SpxH family protein [Chitinophaga skermanii]RAI97700.1 putative DsbA family dithiol-disulfide isomerase [Chitinophaga skermanii]
MRKLPVFFTAVLCMLLVNCTGQTKNKPMSNTNPLLCDPATGVCEIPSTQDSHITAKTATGQKPVKLVYFTDPICSSCWGIEPQLRKLKLEYGQDVEIEYHMGGLLPDWSYNSGGISKPSDVAHHWDEVSAYYNMPIDGDVWLEDPLDSSYPPSIAFMAAQYQDKEKAVKFLRQMREMVFLQKKNIAKWEHIATAATQAGLDAVQLKADYERATIAFKEDLQYARKMGVRGFPTVFVTSGDQPPTMVYGFKPYQAFEQGIQKMHPTASKAAYVKDWPQLFAVYPTMTTREFAELSEISLVDAEKVLRGLLEEKAISMYSSKNGVMWMKK